uniref:hypothetical protein n=1 Tax=Endozoicomonas sp. ONNA1 TaxID=2828740 RepID=UPI0021488A31
MTDDSSTSGEQQSQTSSNSVVDSDGTKELEKVRFEKPSKSVVKSVSADTQYLLDFNSDDVKLEVRGPDFVLVFPDGVEITLLLAGVMAATEQTLQFKFADGSVISGDEFIAKSSFVESEDVPVSTLKGQESDSEEEETPSGKETEEPSYSEAADSKNQSKASKEIKKKDEEFKKKPVEEVEPRDDDFTDTAQATSTSSSSSPPIEEVTPTEDTSTGEGTSNITFSVSVTNVGSSSAGQFIIGGGGNNSSSTQSDPEQHLEVERFGSSLDGDPDVQLNLNSGLEIYGEDPLLFSDSFNSKNLVLQNDANISDIAAIYVENIPDGWGVAGGAKESDGSWLPPTKVSSPSPPCRWLLSS